MPRVRGIHLSTQPDHTMPPPIQIKASELRVGDTLDLGYINPQVVTEVSIPEFGDRMSYKTERMDINVSKNATAYVFRPALNTASRWHKHRVSELGHFAIVDEEGTTICNPSPMGEPIANLICALPAMQEVLRTLYGLVEHAKPYLSEAERELLEQCEDVFNELCLTSDNQSTTQGVSQWIPK